MTASARKPSYFPAPRPELVERLADADKILDAAMAPNERSIRAGHVLVRAGEPHTLIYRLVAGKVARVRNIEDGRRQVICIFGPGDLLAVKSMLLDRQPDNVEALSRATIRALDYAKGLALAAEHPNVGLRFMWQLAEDERRLHNSDDFVEQVARDYVQRHGPGSLDILRDLADMADEIGDMLSAEAWRDIADAAERTVREGPSES